MPELVMTIEAIFIFQSNNGHLLALNEATGESWIPTDTLQLNKTKKEHQCHSPNTMLGALLNKEKRALLKIKIECVRARYTINGNTWDFIGMSEHYVAYRCRNFICYFNYKKADTLQPNSYWTSVWNEAFNKPTPHPEYVAKAYEHCFIVPCLNQENSRLLCDQFFKTRTSSISAFSDAYFLCQPAPSNEKLLSLKKTIDESIRCLNQKCTSSGFTFFSASNGYAFIPTLLLKINDAHHILELFRILYNAIAEPLTPPEYKKILETHYESISSNINLFEIKSWLILHTAIPEFMRQNINNCKSIDDIMIALRSIHKSHFNLIKILSVLTKNKSGTSQLKST